jgi:hypothetical protein
LLRKRSGRLRIYEENRLLLISGANPKSLSGEEVKAMLHFKVS